MQKRIEVSSDERLLTIDEVSRRLGVSSRSRVIEELPSIRVGRIRRFPERAFVEFLNDRLTA